MKKLFSTSYNPELVHFLLLGLRILIAIFMLTHGYSKMTRLIAGEMRFGDPIGIGPGPSLFLAVFAEVICSVLLLIGLGTRLATIPLIITMLVAAFIAHGDDPFSNKEKALLFVLVYFTILVLGAGKYSVDQWIAGRKRAG